MSTLSHYSMVYCASQAPPSFPSLFTRGAGPTGNCSPASEVLLYVTSHEFLLPVVGETVQWLVRVQTET